MKRLHLDLDTRTVENVSPLIPPIHVIGTRELGLHGDSAMKHLGALLCLAALSAAPVTASIIHVPGDRPTIQAGINAASSGDIVLVAPGTYIENINFMGKAITVKSSNGAKYTIID